MQSLLKYQGIFSQYWNPNPKIYIEHKGWWIAQANLKKNKAGVTTLSNFKLYYKATLITTAMCLHKGTQKDQWNRSEILEISPHTYSQSIAKEARIYNGKNTASSINDVGKTGQLYVKVKLGHFLTLYTKLNSKWIKGLSVIPETMKLLKENISSMFFDIGLRICLFGFFFFFFWLCLMEQGK